MPPVSYTPELKKILLRAGCEYRRPGRGDHEIWYSPISKRCFTVDGSCKSRHTANGALKEAGLSKAF